MAFGVESLDFFTGSELFHADVVGCMDENNLNYDPAATINDGDRCGGCIEGYTRLGDPAFLCQEVRGKYIDCKTGEVYWRLKTEFHHYPSLSSYYAVSPAEVPNFLGLPNSTPAKPLSPQQTPANVAAQNTSTTLTTLTSNVEPVAQPQGTNWTLLIGVAIGAYLLAGQTS